MARSIGLLSESDIKFWQSFGGNGFGAGTMTPAGTPVGPITGLKVSANLACIRLIAKMMAAVPCHLYKRRNPKNPQSGKDIADQHPTDQLLALSPCPDMTAYTWQIRGVHNRATWGASYDTIDFNNLGQAVALWPSISTNVEPVRVDNLSSLTVYDDISRPGSLAYQITKTWPQHTIETWPASRVLAIPSDTSLNGVVGIPPADLMRLRFGIYQALQKWESDFFGHGYSPAMIGSVNEKIPHQKSEEIVEKVREQYAGFKSNHGLFLSSLGMDIKPFEHRLDHAMLADEYRNVVEEICGFWGISPVLIGRLYGATFNNTEQYWIQALKLAIFPWSENDRQSFDMKLLTPAMRRDGFFTGYDFSALDQVDADSWAKMIQAEWLSGSITPNEIREQRGRNPLDTPNADKGHVQMQMRPLDAETDEPEEAEYQPADDSRDEAERRVEFLFGNKK